MPYLTVNEAKKNFHKLMDKVTISHEPAVIKGKNNNVILISQQDWDDIQETLLVASNKKLSDSIKKGLKTDFNDCSKTLED